MNAAPIDVKSIKSRSVKVEIAYKSPHTAPNGLQTTKDGLWIADARSTDGAGYVSLVNFADGKVVRDFQIPGLADASGRRRSGSLDCGVGRRAACD